MKRCPKCNSIYTNDQLIYCLSDGASLESGNDFDSAPTMVVNPAFNLPSTGAVPRPAIPHEPEKRGRSIQSIALIIMLPVAGILVGLLIAYILLRPAAPTTSSTDNRKASNTSQSKTETRERETSTRPSPATPSPATSSTPTSQDRRWFVVLGTFAAYDRSGANGRLEQMKAEGFSDAYIVDTNGYSNFTPDRLAVVLGPYAESEARQVGGRVRSVTPTIKPGW